MVDIEKETKGPAAPPQREKKEECCYLSIKIDQIILKKKLNNRSEELSCRSIL
jgi:hypothetical protein